MTSACQSELRCSTVKQLDCRRWFDWERDEEKSVAGRRDAATESRGDASKRDLDQGPIERWIGMQRIAWTERQTEDGASMDEGKQQKEEEEERTRKGSA